MKFLKTLLAHFVSWGLLYAYVIHGIAGAFNVLCVLIWLGFIVSALLMVFILWADDDVLRKSAATNAARSRARYLWSTSSGLQIFTLLWVGHWFVALLSALTMLFLYVFVETMRGLRAEHEAVE